MKMKNLGKKIAIIYIVLAIIVAILITTVLYQVITNWGKSDVEQVIEQASKEENIIKAKDILYDNGWDKEIVSEIKDEVPIPKGFTYVEGTLQDGLIIQEEGTQNKLLWIPLDEEVDLSIADEYYENVEVPEMDSETYQSMKKYGGFYVNLGNTEEYTELKDITEEEYETAIKNTNKLYKNNDSVNTHVLYKEEIAQIMAYSDKIGVSLLETAQKEIETKALEKEATYNIDKLVNENNKGIKVEKTSKDKSPIGGSAATILQQWTDIDQYVKEDQIYYTYESLSGKRVQLPKGFKFKDEEKYVKIADKNNQTLIYVWVPVEGKLEDVRSKVIEKFNTLDIDKNVIDKEFHYSMITEKIPPEMRNSIEKLGGFYMGEAELSWKIENNKKIYGNIARDMSKEFTSAEKDDKGKIIADYVRKSNLVEDGATVKDLINEAQKVAQEIQTQSSVKSHLAYGVEYDSAALWLIDTGAATTEQIMKDSSELGKYAGKYDKNKLLKTDFNYLNGLWGLGGNLAELSQEEWSFNDGEASGVILRGGSYITSGNIMQGGIPIQGINTIQGWQLEEPSDSKESYYPDSIGIRNCLYINIEYDGKDEDKEEQKDGYTWQGNWTNYADRYKDKEGNIKSLTEELSGTDDYSKAENKATCVNQIGDTLIYVDNDSEIAMTNIEDVIGNAKKLTDEDGNTIMVDKLYADENKIYGIKISQSETDVGKFFEAQIINNRIKNYNLIANEDVRAIYIYKNYYFYIEYNDYEKIKYKNNTEAKSHTILYTNGTPLTRISHYHILDNQYMLYHEYEEGEIRLAKLYNEEGQLYVYDEAMQSDEDCRGICVDEVNKKFYAILENDGKNSVVEVDPETNKFTTIYEAKKIRNISIYDGKLYAKVQKDENSKYTWTEIQR